MVPEHDDHTGVECPRCGCRHMINNRGTKRFLKYTIRYRTCRHCGKKVRTKECITHEYGDDLDSTEASDAVEVQQLDQPS